MRYTQKEIYIIITFCLVPSPHLQAFLPFKKILTRWRRLQHFRAAIVSPPLSRRVSGGKNPSGQVLSFLEKSTPPLQKVGVYKLPKRLPALNEAKSRVIMTVPF